MTFQDPAGERERRELRRTISVIRGSNPDHEARVRTRARQTGVSATALRILPEDQWPAAETSAARADSLLVHAPRTALSLSDEGFARVASDDVETLVGIERTVAPPRPLGEVQFGTGFGLPVNGGVTFDYFSRTAGGEPPRRVANTPGNWVRGIWTSVATLGDMTGASMEIQVADAMSALGITASSGNAQWRYDRAQEQRRSMRPDLQGSLQIGAYGALESTAMLVPALAASVLLRNPAPVLAMAGGMTQTEAYGRYRGRGASAGEAFLGAGLEGSVEVLTEMIPMGALVDALGGDRIVRNLLLSKATDIFGEQVATHTQDAIDTAIANPDKTWGDYFAERPDAAVQTLVSSLVQQAIFSAGAGLTTVLLRDEQDREALKKSEQGVRTVENLMALSEASKLRERSPEDFADFVRQATADGPLESVYIKADVFAQSAAAAGVSVDDLLQTMPYLREQMPTALATNGDLKIDTADFAAYIAPQTFAQSLLPHLKADAAGFSRSEAEAFVAQQGERLRQDVEAAVQAGQVNEQAMRSMDVVREQVLAELQKAGRFTRDVNTGYADLVANFYAATAARMGITAEELADRFPLRVRAELPQSGQRAVLDQEAELDLFHMSGAEGLTRTDPLRWGQNRTATSREEASRAGMGAPGRTYFGIRGGYQPERVIRMTSPFEYSARVPASRVYDYDADPQNLRPEGPLTPEAASAYESAIQAAGFMGYRTERLGGVAALFEPVDVRQTGPVRTAAEANALNARMRELAQADRLARLEARPAGSTTPVTARDPETFREQALAELFPDRVFGQRELTPAEAEARAARLADEIPGLKASLPYLSTDEKAKLRRDTAAKIAKLIEDFPDAEEMAAVAYAGRAKRGWYENSAQAILSIFGAKDAPRFAALLAALSPQTSVESNTFNALATWVNWIEAGRPTDRREIVWIMGKSVQGKGTTESVLNAWINNSVLALSEENPATITLSGPKVNSFMLNLLGVVDEVTNDSWMASYALVDQSVFKKTGAVPGKGPGYMAMNAVVRRAAEIATERTGEDWTPAEIQETVWSWAKALYEKRDAAGERRSAQVIAASDLTVEDIASTPDFAVLFVDGVFRRILEAGGYGAELEALDARGQPARRDATGGDPRSAEGSGLGEAEFFRYVDQAAARLEELRARRNEASGAAPAGQLSLFAQGPVEAPLEGQPQTVNIPGRGRTVFGPHAPARQAARDYMAAQGLRYEPPTAYAPVDTGRAERIAQAFEEMKHDPSDPLVATAYRAMIDETLAQWQAIKATGLKVEFITGADPYAATPRLAILDVVENNHLWVFPTDDGFGSSGLDVSDNPLLEMTGEFIDGRELRANDVFRIVHDYFGHIKDGNGFRADGEENAWQSHAAMYSPLARRAMTTETRGQNSWVNFGPYAGKNRTASAADTVYADQKIGLLPEWVSNEGFLGGAQTGQGRSAVDVPMFHGTAYVFDTFEAPPGDGIYFSSDREYAAGYADVKADLLENPARVVEARLMLRNPLEISGDDKVRVKQFTGRKFLAAELEAQGYDGVVVRYSDGEIEAMVLRPEQISAGATFNQSQPTFYSALTRAVELSPLTKAPAAQWLATIRKTAGVKAEEIEWTGLEAWLETLSAPVNEEQRAFLVERGQIDAKGNVPRDTIVAFLRAGGVQLEETVQGEAAEGRFAVEEEYEGQWVVRDQVTRAVYERFDTQEEAEEYAASDDLRVGFGAQFSAYKLPGADDTYRELLFRLPKIDGPSTHWDERNVVAHARFTERKDAEGARVLFLEELQSDWHQKGRDEGYRQAPDPAREEGARTALAEAQQGVRDALAKVAAEGGEAFRQALIGRENMRGSALSWLEGSDAVAQRVFSGDLDSGAKRAIEQALGVDRYLELRAEFLTAQDFVRLRAAELRAAQGGAEGIPDAPFRTSWPTMVMKRMIRWAVDNGYDKVAWINGNQQNGGQTGGDGSFFYERNLVNDTNKLLKSYGAKVEKIDMIDAQQRELASGVLEVRRDRVRRREEALARTPEGTPGHEQAQDAVREAEEFLALAEAEAQRPSRGLGIQNGFVLNDKLREAALQGFSLFQENRGQIAFGADITQTPTVISLLKTADLSTFLHETGHFFLEVTAHIARQPDAPAGIVEDMGAILSWFRPGMTLAEWDALPLEQKRPFHETFARGFEAYLFEGRSPSPSLRDLFRRFSAWLKNVYRSLTALDVELTDEVRSVFDRMVASADDIATTEQARAFAPLFSSMPEGMTKFEWEEYQRLGTEATQAAVEGLEQRSLRDMQWASGARSRALKGLQRQANEQRKTVRDEVTAEVMAEPANRARQFLRRGIGDDGEPIPDARKLDLATLKSLYGENGAWTKLRRGGKYGEVATDGMHPDAVAELFGFPSGEALIDALVNGEPTQAKIDGITDQRMLERYGDLSSVEAIERAADEAVANDARAKFIAAEMSALDKAVGKRSILNEAARDYAAGVVNRTIMNRLRPAQYIAAQTRAAKEAEAALRKDDLVAAATAKRNQLINLHVARQVQAAQKDAEKTMRLFKRIIDAKDATVSRTRNMDMVNAARAVLAAYGLGRVKNDPAAYMEALKRYDPTLYADLEPFVQGARGQAKPLHEITYEQFQGLRDTVNQLWALSRRSRQIEIDGQLLDRKMVVGELNARMLELGLKAGEAGVTRAATDKELFSRKLAGARASLRRVESWARGVDGGDKGPFRRFIWNPISTAADAYRAEARTYILRFRDLVKTVEDRLKPVKIAAPELGYTFGSRAELYHALLHTGNQSNKSKLLLGRRWGDRTSEGLVDDTRWAAFLDRMHAEGVLEQRDWDFVQAVWNLLEETKPGAQRAHRHVYGRYFDEIAADPVETPFGTYRGGYVPALTDAYLVQDAVLRAEQEAVEGGDSAMFPAASNGFTKSRVEDYTRELALDLRLLPSHIDKVLLFTHLGPPVRDVARLFKDRSLSGTMQAFDPVAQTDLLLPWLQRAAKQIVETPTKGQGGKLVDNVFSAIRSRTGMQLMFANVLNTVQQITGFSGVFLRVKPSYVGAALWKFMRDPAGTTQAVAELSSFMANRQQSDMYEARQIIEQLVKLDPGKLDQVRMFMQRHAYFLQTALQNAMDAVSWPAAYDQALARGDTPAEAVRFADSVIRETQGTMSPEDISRFETGPPFVRMFTQFASYFNMLANLNATEVQTVARGVGVRKGAGRLLYVYLMGFAVPALLGEAIAVAMRGSWEDDEEDGYMDELLEFFLLGQAKFALAAVPGVGQTLNAAIGATTDVPYDDRINLSPGVSSIEAAAGVPAAVYQSIVEGDKWSRTDTRDTFTLLGLISGLPLGAVGRPAGYAVGVAQGEIEPEGPLDAARGMVTGVPSAESRQ